MGPDGFVRRSFLLLHFFQSTPFKLLKVELVGRRLVGGFAAPGPGVLCLGPTPRRSCPEMVLASQAQQPRSSDSRILCTVAPGKIPGHGYSGSPENESDRQVRECVPQL